MAEWVQWSRFWRVGGGAAGGRSFHAFRVAARRNRLLGEWAAGLMGLTEEETDAYKKAVVQADFEEAGDEDVIRKLLGDLTAAETDVSEADIRAKLDECAVEARRQLMSES